MVSSELLSLIVRIAIKSISTAKARKVLAWLIVCKVNIFLISVSRPTMRAADLRPQRRKMGRVKRAQAANARRWALSPRPKKGNMESIVCAICKKELKWESNDFTPDTIYVCPCENCDSDDQVFTMPKPKVEAHGHIVWDNTPNIASTPTAAGVSSGADNSESGGG